MEDIATILIGLQSDSAKQRERVIKGLTSAALQDARVIEQLQVLVSADPAEYVREAARAQLVVAGQLPRESIVPVQLKQEGAGRPALIVIGCVAIPIILVCVAVVVLIAILAILGPQIGNVFSRVTNGLGSP